MESFFANAAKLSKSERRDQIKMSNFSFFKRTGKGVAARWREQYTSTSPKAASLGYSYWPDESKRAIYDKLVALGEDPDPDQVDAIIGNGSWTRVACNANEDHQYVDKDAIINSFSTTVLCMECFKELQACVEAGNK